VTYALASQQVNWWSVHEAVEPFLTAVGSGWAAPNGAEPLFFYREGLGGNLNNYVRTEATVREILRVCGTPMLGTWRTRGLVMRSWLKTLAYRAGTKLGLQGVLIRRRNRTLDARIDATSAAIIADMSAAELARLLKSATELVALDVDNRSANHHEHG